MDAYEKLANGIIEQAVKDYRKAARFMTRHPRTKELEETVASQLAEREQRQKERKPLGVPMMMERKSKEERWLDKIFSNECQMLEAERFFYSEWFGKLTDIDGQWLLERLRREWEA